MTVSATRARATRREWIGLAVISLPCLLYSMDATVLNLAVPSLSADLKPSSSELLWIVDVYGFLLAGSLITMGTLGDRIGRRRLLLIGATAFGIVSIAAAFSKTAGMLIATRALLGVAGATLAPSTLSLIRNMFLDAEERTVAVGIWTASFSVGAAIGPLLGGLLLERYWWGSVFLVSVPVMMLLLVLGPALLPEFRDPAAGRLDLVSAALSLVAVLLFIYGLKRVAEDGFGRLPVLFIVSGVALAVTFLLRQSRLSDPLIDLTLFRVPAFSVSLATNLLSLFAAFGAFLYIAQYLQLVLGLSPLQAGLWTLPWAGGLIAGSLISPMMARRMRPSLAIAAGLVVEAIGLMVLSRVGGSPTLPVVATGSVLLALGVAPAVTLATDSIVSTAAPERAGAASSMSETSSELGGALGIAVLGSIGTAVYRSRIGDAVATGIPREVAEVARGTLGGAVEVAHKLPDPLRADLLAAARDAFDRAFQVTSAVGAGVVLVMAVLVLTLLRKGGRGPSPEPQPDSKPEKTLRNVDPAPARSSNQQEGIWSGSRSSTFSREPTDSRSCASFSRAAAA